MWRKLVSSNVALWSKITKGMIFRDLRSMYIYFTAELILDEKENFDCGFPWRFVSTQYQPLLQRQTAHELIFGELRFSFIPEKKQFLLSINLITLILNVYKSDTKNLHKCFPFARTFTENGSQRSSVYHQIKKSNYNKYFIGVACLVHVGPAPLFLT